MNAAAVLAAELRAGYAGSWVITGQDRAEHFAEDLARRGVRTLAGAKLRQVGTVNVPAGTKYVHDSAVELYEARPAYVVDFAGGPALGYGDGFKGYAEPTLQADRLDAIARTTAGDGAVLLTVVDIGGGRAGFVPYWQTTSDKGDIVASIIGIGAVVGAGFLAGAGSAGAAGASAAPGAASSAGAAAGVSSALDKAWTAFQEKATGAAAKAATIKLTQALAGSGSAPGAPSVAQATQGAGSSWGLWIAAGAAIVAAVAVL